MYSTISSDDRFIGAIVNDAVVLAERCKIRIVALDSFQVLMRCRDKVEASDVFVERKVLGVVDSEPDFGVTVLLRFHGTNYVLVCDLTSNVGVRVCIVFVPWDVFVLVESISTVEEFPDIFANVKIN